MHAVSNNTQQTLVHSVILPEAGLYYDAYYTTCMHLPVRIFGTVPLRCEYAAIGFVLTYTTTMIWERFIDTYCGYVFELLYQLCKFILNHYCLSVKSTFHFLHELPVQKVKSAFVWAIIISQVLDGCSNNIFKTQKRKTTESCIGYSLYLITLPSVCIQHLHML